MEEIKKIVSIISPKLLTKLLFYKNFKKRLNLRNPKDINEKIQYLKFNNYFNNEVITNCVDKYMVRKYLKKLDLDRLCPTLYGVYDNVNQINWDILPEKFVIKCNHGSGMNIICLDKTKLDINETIKKLDFWMKTDFWKLYGEIHYKNINKKIIIEELLDENILTYKFYCFNGNVKISYVSLNGENGEKEKYLDYFDKDWNRLNITLGKHEHYPGIIEKPINYEEMIFLAEKLSKNFPFVRVDLYNLDGKIYFSELTFIPTGGMMQLKPEKTATEWGEWLYIN
ncbi:ATP-grasp fold amidoligase family protein [Clostridium perfringens]|uniref:ATP-grasp fold amidoligase family protein n=1 Tax=Clostridium perfringens TaxID=1502 RepID=UPI0018E456D2|nr:ATP-grasp fold amidoligase family protein [Clostridium perfringens]MBI6060429.1 glycosyl transferase [Clostridium perfringens]